MLPKWIDMKKHKHSSFLNIDNPFMPIFQTGHKKFKWLYITTLGKF